MIQKILLPLSAFVLAATTAFAATPPALSLTDGVNTLTLDGGGAAPSCVGSCSTALYSVQPGSIKWAGLLGSIDVDIVVGSSKPAFPPNKIQIALLAETTAVGGVLTLKWSDTGFYGSGAATMTAADTPAGSGNVVYTTYVDPSNTLFGQATQVGTLSHAWSGSAPYAQTITGSGPTSSPFSMTAVAEISLAPNSALSLSGLSASVTPCSGAIGDFVWNDVNGNGIQDAGEIGINGVTVQLYKGAVLPANLIGTQITGPAPAGYGFANGYYQFTGLCAENYNVVVNPNQAPLSGYTPSPSFQGGNPVSDSNASPANTTLTTDSSTDETLDFGFTAVPPPTLTCPASAGEVGVPYSSTLAASGGFSPYTFSAVGLPAWLTLVPTTGALSGIPPAPGPISFTATVADARGNAAGTNTQNCTITISRPSLACSATNSGEVGVSFDSGPLTVTGGTPPYTFYVDTGSLPSGLSLDTLTGRVYGAPATAGSFTLAVKDSLGAVGTGICPYAFIPGPSLTCLATGTTGEVGVPFSSPALTVAGGTTPYTFAVVGTLPVGLTLNTTTGAITGTPTAPGTFSIRVTDANGITATGTCPYTIAAAPSLTCLATGTTGEVGVPFSSPALTVAGGTPPYTFAIVGTLPAGLTLNPATGAVTGTPTAPGTFSIKVTDANGITATGTCPYTIVAAPSLTCLATGTAGEVGVPFNSPSLTVAGGTAPYSFAIVGTLPAGLTLNATTGAITGTPTTPGTFSIKVTDAKGVTATGTCPYTIVAAPSLTCLATGTTGIVGKPFSSPALTVAGGTAPYSFAIVGTLPAGLTLNATTGAITGTPTTPGTFSIKVTDAKGVTATGNCPYTITAVTKIDLDCATCSSILAFVGKPYSASLIVNGGMPPYTFSVVAGSLPPGLTLDTADGSIDGTPTAPGLYVFTTKVVDSLGNWDTSTCLIIVLKSPVQLTCGACNGTLGSANVGVFYSDTLTISGGTAPYTFSLISGSLPPGLTLNSGTGKISGTPTTPGTYTFTIKVVDAKGFSATATCTIVVKSPVDLTCGACGSTAGSGQTGVAYSDTLAVAGGIAPYTFSLISGSLPPGLTLNSGTGKITGTPTTAGSYTFTAKVVDSKGNSDTATCTIVIKANPIDLSCGACGSAGTATVGVVYSDTLTVTNGVSPYTFSLVSGSLPPGLTLNSITGKIAGTPTTAGTYTFTVKVVDSRGRSDTATCTIAVKAIPVNVTCGACGGSTGAATLGTPYADTLAVSGGIGPYTFSIVSGSLPPGLSLNSTTGKITGTPTTSGTYGFTVKAVDSQGKYDTDTCAIVVKSSPVNLDCGTCGSTTGYAKVGYYYSDTLDVTGGSAPYTFSIISGSLPLGLTLNTTTGKITGTPTRTGTYTFTIKAVDSRGASDTATCTLVVKYY